MIHESNSWKGEVLNSSNGCVRFPFYYSKELARMLGDLGYFTRQNISWTRSTSFSCFVSTVIKQLFVFFLLKVRSMKYHAVWKRDLDANADECYIQKLNRQFGIRAIAHMLVTNKHFLKLTNRRTHELIYNTDVWGEIDGYVVITTNDWFCVVPQYWTEHLLQKKFW